MAADSRGETRIREESVAFLLFLIRVHPRRCAA
jgi:hypothetical protein